MQLEYLDREVDHVVHPHPAAVIHQVEALQAAALQSWVLRPGWLETVTMQGCLPGCLNLHIHTASVHTN